MTPDEIPAQVPRTLVQTMCYAKLDPLTKAGAVSAGITKLGWGTASLAIGVVGSIIMFTSDVSYEEMARTLGATFGWLGLLFVPLLPAVPYVFVMLAVTGAGLLIAGGMQASAAKAMGTFEFRCPRCQRNFSLTRARRNFEIVCPDCHTLIRRDKSGTINPQRCDYCGLVFLGPAETPFQCPGCQYKVGARQTTCPQCKKALPKNVLFCRECQSWTGLPEMYWGSSTEPAKHYDVGCFSPAICRAYIMELEKRIGTFADQLAQLGAAGPTPFQSVGFTIAKIESSLHLLHKCTLAVQWLYLTKECLHAELVSRLAAHAQRIWEALEKLRATNMLSEKYERQFWPVVSEARATFAAAERAST